MTAEDSQPKLHALLKPVDAWLLWGVSRNPWVPLINWRTGFLISRTQDRWPKSVSNEPVLMATPAGLASPRLMAWDFEGDLESSDAEHVFDVLKKAGFVSVVALVASGLPARAVEAAKRKGIQLIVEPWTEQGSSL